MYFKTSDELQATYTIHCEGYNDFSRTLNNNTLSGYTTNHEYLLVGAIPGQINTITVTLTNKQGNLLIYYLGHITLLLYKVETNI